MTAAVLLLVISLSAITVQAAPVHTLSTTSAVASPGSELTASAGRTHGAVGCISSNEPHHAAGGLNNPCTPSSSHHHTAPIPAVHRPEPIKAEKAEPVALERRKSLAAKFRASVRKTGHAIKKAVKSIARVVKTVVKVGLKLVATAEEVVGKAVRFIPGLPPGASKFLEQSGSKLNKVSDGIHAHIGGRLGKAMHGLDEAQKVAAYIPRSIMSEMDDFDL